MTIRTYREAARAFGFFGAVLVQTTLAYAQPTLVQKNASDTGSATGTVSFTSQNKAGDLIIVQADWAGSSAASSISDTLGNSYLQVTSQVNSVGGNSQQIFYAKNIKAGTNKVTFKTASSSDVTLYVSEYSGVDVSSPLDTVASASGSGTSASSGAVTTHAAGELIYGGVLSDYAMQSAGSGFTALSLLNGNLAEFKVAGAAGSYSVTGTNDSSGWYAQAVTFKPAPSASPSPSPSPTVTPSPSPTATPSPSSTPQNQPPTVASPASATSNPTSGKSVGLKVLGADDGGEASLTYAWVTTGTPPGNVTFSPNGTNASKATTATFTAAGSYSLRATIIDAAGLSVASTVTVVVNSALTAITVAPTNPSVTAGGTLQFSASATDQFGSPLSPQPSIGWSVNGGGSISPTGLLTAGSSGGSFLATAASGSVSGTASFTVIVPAPSPTPSPSAPPSTLPPSLVQSAAHSSSSSTNTVSFSSNNRAGDLIVVTALGIRGLSIRGVADSLGNVYRMATNYTTSPAGNFIQIFYAANVAAGANQVSISFSAADVNTVYVSEYAGVDPVAPLDVTASASGPASQTPNSGTATTSVVNELIYGAVLADNVVGGAGPGFTALSSLDGNLSEYKIVSGTGAYSASSGAGNDGWVAQMAAFKGAPGTGPAPSPTPTPTPTPSSSPGPQSYSTTFPKVEDPISENGRWVTSNTPGVDWSALALGGCGCKPVTRMAVTSPGLAQSPDIANDNVGDALAVLTGNWGADQTASVVVFEGADVSGYEEIEIHLRTDPATGRGYEITWALNHVYGLIVTWNSNGIPNQGGYTVLLDDGGSQFAIAPGDTLSASIKGNVISMYRNSTLVAKYTDTFNFFTSGNPGFGFNEGSSGNYGITSFSASSP